MTPLIQAEIVRNYKLDLLSGVPGPIRRAMKWASGHLKFYFWRLLEVVFAVGAVFIPLALSLSVWAHRNFREYDRAKCEAVSRQLTEQLRTLSQQPSSTEILFEGLLSKEPAGWIVSKAEFHTQNLSALGIDGARLIENVQVTSQISNQGLAEGQSILFRATQNEKSVLNVLSAGSSTVKWQMINASRALEFLPKDPTCNISVFNSTGQLIVSNNNITPAVLSHIYSLVLKQPPSGRDGHLMVNLDSGNVATVQEFMNGTFATHFVDDSAAFQSAKRTFLAILLVGFFFVCLLVVLYTPRWFGEVQIAHAFSGALEKLLHGDFTARPRIFIGGHFGEVEKKMDQLGAFLTNLRKHGSSFSRFSGNWEQYNELSSKAAPREIAMITLELNPLGETIPALTEMTQIMHSVHDIFTRFVTKNAGQVTSLTSTRLQAVWGMTAESEFDSPSSAMAALEIRIALDAVNKELVEKNLMPFRFGIGLHRAPAFISTFENDYSADLLVLGDASFESEGLAKLALQSKTEILVSEVIATLIEPYFILAKAQVPTSNVRIFTISGYIDSEENQIHLKSFGSKH